MYRIEILPKAKRQLKAIPREMQTLLKNAIRNLSETPRTLGVKNSLVRITYIEFGLEIIELSTKFKMMFS
jgi:mRNA-degrading endonuclease RelE of RelBE toxin-antitoxin system